MSPTSHTLDNGRIQAAFDERGRLLALHRHGEHEWIRNPRDGVWRLFLCRPDDLEIPILPADQEPPCIEAGADSLTMTYPRLVCRLGTLEISLVIRVAIRNDELVWNLSVDNREDIMVSEAWLPLIGDLADPAATPDQGHLAWPCCGGLRIPNPRQWLKASHSGYLGADQYEIIERLHYPWPASMPWCDLHSDGHGLCVAMLDERFRNSCLVAMREGEAMSLGCVRYPLIGKGQRWVSPDTILAPHRGDWRWGARRYRQWADRWFVPPVVPDWLPTWFGWQRTILKHQYGEVLWTYDQIKELTRHALDADLDCLHLLGWWRGGMDRGYPHYDCDDRLGGEAAFRDAIAAARGAGLKVLPYMNGHLLDTASPTYREHGEAWCARSLLGTEYRETYPFWGRGSLVKALAPEQVQHAIPCPSIDGWWGETERVVRQIAGYGADGVIIDQLGGCMSYMCFAEGHPHDRPDEAFPAATSQQLAALRRAIKADHPDFVIATEHFTDLTARHVDFVHGCGPGYSPARNAFPSLVRYTFPETIILNRDGGYDETDYRRHIGFALLHGFRVDMSVYRCRGSMADLPNYARLLPKVRTLHRASEHRILAGRYQHHDGHAIDCAGVEHAAYTSPDGTLTVVAWNPTPEALTCAPPECNRPLESTHTLDGPAAPGAAVRMAPDDVAVWVFGSPDMKKG